MALALVGDDVDDRLLAIDLMSVFLFVDGLNVE